MNMPILTQFGNSEQKMSSKDLLDLINHVRAQFGEPMVRLNKFNEKIEDELEGENYTKSVVQNFNNTESVVFDLTIDQCMLIGMRESKGVRKNVLAILKEKQSPQVPDLNNPAQLRDLLLGYAEQNIQLQQQVQNLEPKAKGLDRIAECTNVLGIRESAKVLKVGQSQLVQYLIDHKVVYRDQHSKIQAYQRSIDQKLVHVVTSAPRLFESGEKVFTQVKLTQKLITRIAKWLEQGVAA